MEDMKKDKKNFFSKLNLEDLNLDDLKIGTPYYRPNDPYAGERLLQQIKNAELKKAEAQEKKANRRKVLFIGILVIGGFFAYKKFKK